MNCLFKPFKAISNEWICKNAKLCIEVCRRLNLFIILLYFRTAILFLLPVILEILLIIVIYSALRLFKFCKRSKLFTCIFSFVTLCKVPVLFRQCDAVLVGFFQSVNEAEEGQYVTMHRSQSSHVSSAAQHHHSDSAIVLQ